MKRLTAMLAWVCVALGAILSGPGAAQKTTPVQDPQGAVLEVLCLDGQDAPISKRLLTLDELKTLPQAGFETTTIWTDGVQRFRGVWLSDLMTYLEITDDMVHFSALNEYLVEFSQDDMVPGGPLLAYERNGLPLSPRDKGPLWVVFPYDSDVKYQTESVFAQSIWQMDRIEISR